MASIAPPTIAVPGDALQAEPWAQDGTSDRWFRRFAVETVTIRTAIGRAIEIRTEGEQFDDDSAWRTIALETDDFDGLAMLTPLDARTVAAALVAAADRIEKLD